MTKNNTNIILFVAIIVLSGALGFIWGRQSKKIPPPVVIDTHKIDSLIFLNKALEDSVMLLDSQRIALMKKRVEWRIKYDTIKIETNPDKLLENLRTIANTPID